MPATGSDFVGSYEVIREIGRGGMGVVYLARDTRLDREVAIKCLPDELADDADRLARFEREAKSLASLNHPNIASIHGLEEIESRRYLVLEYVPGETLDQRLQRGPIPVGEAVSIALQIAEAAEAAHDRGIIHRDLKPANIKFVDRESIKVLDFGLAKAQPRPSHGAGPAAAPTVTAGATSTMPGVVLGTPGYLSPEQARGYEVDTRSDVFSFGCILFEMLTGRVAFGAATVSDSIASVLEKEPDWSLLPEDLPGSLRRLVRRCLAKDRRRRLQAIGDARVELEESAESGVADPEPPTGHVRRPALTWIPWALVGALGIAVVLLIAGRRDAADGAPERVDRSGAGSIPLRAAVALPEGASLGWLAMSATSLSAVGQSRLLAMSRDGLRLVCTARSSVEGAYLYLKDPRTFGLESIADTLNARAPFFSPDGESIGFLQDGVLRKMRLPDGPPQEVCRVVSTGFDATWTTDGVIIYAADDGLWRVAADGMGEPVRLAVRDREGREIRCRFPNVSHDGHSLFLTVLIDGGVHAAMMSLRGEDRTVRILFPDASDVRDVRDGYLLFARAGTVQAATFDPERPDEGVGPPVPIGGAADLHTTPGYDGVILTHFATSDSTTLAFSPAVARLEDDALVWVERGSRETTIASGAGLWMHPRLSPDQKRILLDIHGADGTRDLFIYHLEREQLRQLTTRGSCFNAEWSPHDGGRSVVYCAAGPAGRAVYSITTDFASTETTILPSRRDQWPHLAEWTRDGSLLFWDRKQGGTWRLPAGGNGELTALMSSEANERWGVVSPDGNFIAYVADEQGAMQVFVQPYPALGREIQVSTRGGSEPLWSHDGATLFFRHEDKVHASSFESDPTVEVGLPTEVLEGEYNLGPPGHQHYDVSSDGRFLMIKEGRSARHETVRLIHGWSALVRQHDGS